jgi:hypothetical protein
LYGDSDRKRKCEQFKFPCCLPIYDAVEKAKCGVSALTEAVWTLSCDKDGLATLSIFNSRYPLPPLRSETREFQGSVERDIRKCFSTVDMENRKEESEEGGGSGCVVSEASKGSKLQVFSTDVSTYIALVVRGIPASIASDRVVAAVNEFFVELNDSNPQTSSVDLVSRDFDHGAITLRSKYDLKINGDIGRRLAVHLGSVSNCHLVVDIPTFALVFGAMMHAQVFAWIPMVVKWLDDEKTGLLSGIMLANIPIRCAKEELEDFKAYMSRYSGVQKYKLPQNTRVIEAFAVLHE